MSAARLSGHCSLKPPQDSGVAEARRPVAVSNRSPAEAGLAEARLPGTKILAWGD